MRPRNGVQWHAELLVDRGAARFFEALVRAAEVRAGDAAEAASKSPDELPAWARWNADPERPAWTVGLEEEVMLLDPADWTLANRIDDLLPRLSPELTAHVCRRDARLHARAVHRRAQDRGRGVLGAPRPAARSRRAAERTRPARRGRGYAPHGCVRGDRGVGRGALPGARAGPPRPGAPRADLRAPRACRHPTARAGDRGLRPDPRSPPAPARPVRQLTFLARARQRDGVVSHTALPGLPTRGDPAALRELRGLRRVHRHAAARRRLPRADLHLVGRAPAAAHRHDRGADRGRPDAPSARSPR